MSPRVYGCVIFGYDIHDHDTPEGKWLKEFQVIWSNPQGCFLSGVGSYDDDRGQLQAPSDPTRRYDDEDYDHHLNKVFYVNICEDRTRAFLSHSTCWKLLEEAFKPNDIPLERFVDICKSLPLAIGIRCFHWGHKYGGILDFDNDYVYPWECRLVNEPSDPQAFECATENPYHIPEISNLVMETAHEPLCAARGFNDQSNDCFKMLPWEIREAIANNLTTRDALALRESSRSFVPLLESPTFWASRFKPGADRGFLFEKTSTAEARDWFTLYRRTSRNQSPPGLKNRIRIWNLIDHIYHLVKMSLDDGVPRLTAPIMHSDKLRVVEAAANIVQPSPDEIYDVFSDGCRFFKTQSASIPQDLLSVELSFVEHEDYYHLTGLSFDSGCGKTLRLGYASSHTMIYNAQTFGGLKGLILAIDDRGIRAVQIVRGDRNRSNWFGSPKGTPVTERLAVMDTTQPIHIGVDAYKIISIGASIQGDISNGSNIETSMSLRSKAFWYPSVPSREINLNERSFIQATPLPMEYFPLEWVHFGGPQGSDLRRLVDMSLVNVGYPSIINFYYTQDGSSEHAMSHFGAYEPRGWSGMTSNPIDGPRGEHIQSVQVAQRHANVCALKVRLDLEAIIEFGRLTSKPTQLITNNGKILESGTTSPPKPFPPYPGAPMPEKEAEAELETLRVAPGTTITGFYASHYHSTFLSFGIVSEVIKHTF